MVTTLNQALINRYQSGPSKRQRPMSNDETADEATVSASEITPSANEKSNDQSTNSSNNNNKSKLKKMKSKNPADHYGGKDLMSAAGENEMETNEKLHRYLSPQPSLRLSDLAGLDTILSQIKEMVFFPVLYPQLYAHLGVRPPCGLLLHGPSGCGKTSIALAIAGELGLPFYKVKYTYICVHVYMYVCVSYLQNVLL